LDAASEIIAEGGIDECTVAAVAVRSGTSVGAVYRRFVSKEQLLYAVKDRTLGQLEHQVAEELDAARGQTLAEIVSVFVHALAGWAASHSHLMPALLMTGDVNADVRGVESITTLNRLLLDVLAPRLGEVDRHDPMTAAEFSARTILGACVHRSAAIPRLPDGISWPVWADQMSDMVTSFLASRTTVPD
jgi:AcrR family transcriptional regulator